METFLKHNQHHVVVNLAAEPGVDGCNLRVSFDNNFCGVCELSFSIGLRLLAFSTAIIFNSPSSFSPVFEGTSSIWRAMVSGYLFMPLVRTTEFKSLDALKLKFLKYL